jgi:formate hydrogenlyase subunit 6/NADH:ubiquinone oxidoreductase subunit I
MKYPKLREIGEAFTSLLSAPYTTKFPKKPHTPFEGFRGKPVVNNEKCVGCLTCSNVCPSCAITVKDDKERGIRKITRNYGKCIFCGQCQAYCITGEGVKLSDKIYDLSTFDRNDELTIEIQEKELLLCNNCGAVITTKEHVQFLHKKLGPKAYSSIIDLNELNEELKLAKAEETKTEITDELQRKDTFNILCPNCLHKILINNLLPNA